MPAKVHDEMNSWMSHVHIRALFVPYFLFIWVGIGFYLSTDGD